MSSSVGPLWTSTLTPVPITYNWTQFVPLSLPQYTDSSYDLWSQSILFNSQAETSLSNDKGRFSYLPLQDRLGYLLTDGSIASSVDWQPAQHTKNDNSNFTYIGRSYGVGSSVGLTDTATAKRDETVAYSYTEVGYHTSVECIRNVSSGFKLSPLTNATYESHWIIPAAFLASGPGPNTTESSSCANGILTDCGGVVTVGLNSSDDIVAAAWWASFESGLAMSGLPNATHYKGRSRPVDSLAYTTITAGKNNLHLNNIQCGISMIPSLFSVAVNVSERAIQTDLLSSESQQDIEPTGFIADSASSILGVMTVVDTAVYTSNMGTMLNRNIQNVKQQENLTFLTEEVILRGVAETLEALIDDYLIAVGSAQLLIANDTLPVFPQVVSNALDVGQKPYVLTTFFINIVIVILYISEAIRTRLWDRLPKFDYVDVKAVVVASSLGGGEIGERVQGQLDGKSDHTEERVKILLDEDTDPMLKLAYDGEEKGGENQGIPLRDSLSEMSNGDAEVDEESVHRYPEGSSSLGAHAESSRPSTAVSGYNILDH